MNERIKEFRFLAADYANEQKPLGTTKWHEIRDEKFAELIVRECLDILEDENDGELTGRSVRIAAIRIKKHFEVEE